MRKFTTTVIIVGIVVLSVTYYEHKISQINSTSFNLHQLYNLQNRSAFQKLYTVNNKPDEDVQNSTLETYENFDNLLDITLIEENSSKSSLINRPTVSNLWLSSLTNLEDIKQNDDNVFFIETSCGTEELMKTNSNNVVVHLNPRQCCAVESVAVMNRNHNVYVLHTCPLNATIIEQSPEYVKQTLAHPNVHIIYFKLDGIIKKSPVNGLFHTQRIGSSKFPVEHLSDVLRYLTLWKYGGTYLDFDTITIRPLDGLKYNYAGRPTKRLVASGVINFRHSGIGHDLVTQILKELNSNFDGSRWAKNGPGAITRMIFKKCDFKNVTQLVTDKCDIFTVYPPTYFYPVYYTRYKVLFKPMSAKRMNNLFKDSYNIHFWNRVSKTTVVEVGSNQTYGLLADKYCPGVYHNCGKYF